MVAVSAWPRCSEPVTFGGGNTMQNGKLAESFSGAKYPRSIHSGYHFDSTSAGSYDFDN